MPIGPPCHSCCTYARRAIGLALSIGFERGKCDREYERLQTKRGPQVVALIHIKLRGRQKDAHLAR
jgi:hypothetical protein